MVWAPACLTWSRLNKHLAPFLQWTLTGGMLGVQWRDNILLQAVRLRYKEHTKWANKMLHDYYMVNNVLSSLHDENHAFPVLDIFFFNTILGSTSTTGIKVIHLNNLL